MLNIFVVYLIYSKVKEILKWNYGIYIMLMELKQEML